MSKEIKNEWKKRLGRKTICDLKFPVKNHLTVDDLTIRNWLFSRELKHVLAPLRKVGVDLTLTNESDGGTANCITCFLVAIFASVDLESRIRPALAVPCWAFGLFHDERA